MSITFIEGAVTGPRGDEATLDFLVDSAAHYTSLPEEVWQKLGLVRKRSLRLRLADGTVIERGVGQCEIKLALGETATPVILGAPGDLALLGAVTLEELGLVLNPYNRTLHPMEMLMA